MAQCRLPVRHFFTGTQQHWQQSLNQALQQWSPGETSEQLQHKVPSQEFKNDEALRSSQPCRWPPSSWHSAPLQCTLTVTVTFDNRILWKWWCVTAQASSGLKLVTMFCCGILENQVKGPCGDPRAGSWKHSQPAGCCSPEYVQKPLVGTLSSPTSKFLTKRTNKWLVFQTIKFRSILLHN